MKITLELSEDQIKILRDAVESYNDNGCGEDLWRTSEANEVVYHVLDRTEIITRGNVDRAYKLCKCYRCGDVSECTPDNDFYVLDDCVEDVLFCERCFWERE